MEHRLSPRKPMDLSVVLYYKGIGMLRCRAKDVSADGLYLDTEQQALRLHTPVEVAIATREAAGISVSILPAMVVRVERNGVGLMFKETNHRIYEAMQAPTLDSSLLSMDLASQPPSGKPS